MALADLELTQLCLIVLKKGFRFARSSPGLVSPLACRPAHVNLSWREVETEK